jgi:uncharacterized protein YcbK (DUF882 family)
MRHTNNREEDQKPSSRRRFLSRSIFAAAAMTVAPGAMAEAIRKTSRDRKLSFYNLHTGEKLTTCYWSQGLYVPESLTDINHILRDFRTNEIRTISPELMDLLFAMRGKLGTQDPFHVISGYRSPATNAILRQHSEGVAKNSLHMQGLAIDIRVPGRRLIELKRVATALRGGGVGYYPASDFVHVDVGRVRYW